jgi:hypothetical protein
VKIACQQMVGGARAHLIVLVECMLIFAQLLTKDGKNKENKDDILNRDESDEESGKKKKSNVSLFSSCCSLSLTILIQMPCKSKILHGNINQNTNIQSLQA